MEMELIKQGFDYVYDKKFYDRLAAGNLGELREHIEHSPYLTKSAKCRDIKSIYNYSFRES